MVQLWLLRYRLLNLQWGCDIGGSYAARRDISFPLTFPTACYSVCTSRGRANTSSYSEGPIELYASKFVYIGAQDANSSYNSCSWIAVGEQQWRMLTSKIAKLSSWTMFELTNVINKCLNFHVKNFLEVA